MEGRLLGFPCFPYSVISMACFENAFHKVTITAKARLGTGTTCPRCGLHCHVAKVLLSEGIGDYALADDSHHMF